MPRCPPSRPASGTAMSTCTKRPTPTVAERTLLNLQRRGGSAFGNAAETLVDAAIAETALPSIAGRPAKHAGVTYISTRTTCAANTCRWTSRWRWSTVSTPPSPISTNTAPGTQKRLRLTNLMRPNALPNDRCGCGEVNASTVHRRRAIGFGAEIGISTQKSACPRTDGTTGIDVDQVDRMGSRPHLFT